MEFQVLGILHRTLDRKDGKIENKLSVVERSSKYAIQFKCIELCETHSFHASHLVYGTLNRPAIAVVFYFRIRGKLFVR